MQLLMEALTIIIPLTAIIVTLFAWLRQAMFELWRAGLSHLLAGQFARKLQDLSETRNRKQSLGGSLQVAV